MQIKRWIFFGLIMLCKAVQLTAQNDSIIKSSQFLFPDFSIGVVKLKTGEIIKANMNYNTITQKMTFSQNGELTDLNKPEAVDTIIIQNRQFIPFKNGFLEVLVNAKVSLYIQHRSDLKSSGRPGAYGTTSYTVGSTSVSTLYSKNNSYDLNVPENFSVVPSPSYWIKINNNLHRIDSERQLMKLFTKNNEEIKQFIKENNINIKKQEDLLNLVDYCNGLIN